MKITTLASIQFWKFLYKGDMEAHKIGSQVARAEPSINKEICYGLTVGLIAGGLWKMHQWNYQKRTREVYDLLDKGVISVVVDED
ncbi:hypothetical protein MRB53_031593 [Persea americana]|uniref:Uncharacterized protein n=1 Tax=Persea americana TaxID=3435 RepID=A0ACC2KPF9_PERAE|nr:hypothetical protein MRB53_031593 [Persea americana]